MCGALLYGVNAMLLTVSCLLEIDSPISGNRFCVKD